MCGIVYAHNLSGTPVNSSIINQYRKQIARGTQGFGFFNGKHIIKTPYERKIIKNLKKKSHKSDTILFHHRYPTSTVNVVEAAHPFTTGRYFGKTKYILVHNGTVNNSVKLNVDHERLYGISYTSELKDFTFNDSESLLWDFALTAEKCQDELQAFGGIAFVCIRVVEGKLDRLYFAKNSYKPLNMLRNDAGIMLSSEGAGEPIEDNTLYTYYYKSNRLTKKSFLVKRYINDTGYKYTPSTSSYSGNQAQLGKTYTIGAGSRQSDYDRTHDSLLDGQDYDQEEEMWLRGYYKNAYGRYVKYESDEAEEDAESKPYSNVTHIQQTLDEMFPEMKNSNAIEGELVDNDEDESFQRYTLMELATEFDVQTEEDKEELYSMFLNTKRSTGFDLLVNYLKRWEGDYENCYEAMEADYVAVESDQHSMARDVAMSTLEEAIELLLKDKDYNFGEKLNALWGRIAVAK